MVFEKNHKIYYPLIVLGLTTNIIQVILLRVFVSIFCSNEVIIGIYLAIWMTFTGLGAWFKTRFTNFRQPSTALFLKFTLLGFLPLVFTILLFVSKKAFSHPGEIIGLWQLLPIMIISMLPVCLTAGNIFSSLTSAQSAQESPGNTLYAIEALGGVLGGLLVSFVMILWLNIFQSLAIIFIISTLTAVTFYPLKKKVMNIIILSASLILSISFFLYPVDLTIRQLQYPNQKIIESHETPYGNLTLTELSGQFNVFENLSLLFTTKNTIYNEETAHYPMLQHSNPEKVFLISGGISGIADEILKYKSVKKLIYIEPNPWILKYSRYIHLTHDPRLTVIEKDGRKFISSDSTLYDVIIMTLPEPASLQMNRYYSVEFIKLLKLHTTKDAVISFSLGTTGNYMNPENLEMHSILFNTLRSVFSHVLIIPGDKNYFIASDKPLSIDIGKLYLSRNIKNTYVNPFYIDDRSLQERTDEIIKNLIPGSTVNTDLKPIAVNVSTSLFFSKFKLNWVLAIFTIVLLMLLPVVKLKKQAFAMYIAGFTTSSLEMIILLIFQIICGLLYAAAGILFAIFMLGLACGALHETKIQDERIFKKPYKIQFLLTVFVAVIPVFLLFMIKINNILLTYPALFVIIFALAFITGRQFYFSQKIIRYENINKTGYVYGADLLGSALGLILVSTILLPMFGFFISVLVLLIINILALIGMKVFVRRDKGLKP
jgi:spermidine synthase